MLMIPEYTAAETADGNAAADAGPNWTAIVASVQTGDREAMERLYTLFGSGIRYYLSRQLGPQDIDDKVHDTFLVVVAAIQRGDLREPERLLGFVRTIVRRVVAGYIGRAVEERKEKTDIEEHASIADERTNPERDLFRRQQVDIMKSVLRSISARDREILTRFYLYEQSQEQICDEMGLNDTQFRLLKSRAKARFAELGKRRMESPNTTENKIMRKNVGC